MSVKPGMVAAGYSLLLLSRTILINVYPGVWLATRDSMDPKISSGSVIICNPDVDPESLETGGVYTFQFGDRILIHEFVERNGDELLFKGPNNTY